MQTDIIWQKVLRFISCRERCEKETREYLKRLIEKYHVGAHNYVPKVPPAARHGVHNCEPLQIIDGVIQRLKSLDFLNEDRFAKAYIHDNFNLKHKGKRRIKQELKRKGINELIIEKHVGAIGAENEAEMAIALARKKYELIKNLPVLTVKRRIFGLLLRRGFSPSEAIAAIEKILEKR